MTRRSSGWMAGFGRTDGTAATEADVRAACAEMGWDAEDPVDGVDDGTWLVGIPTSDARTVRRCGFLERTTSSGVNVNVSQPNRSPCCSAANPSTSPAVMKRSRVEVLNVQCSVFSASPAAGGTLDTEY